MNQLIKKLIPSKDTLVNSAVVNTTLTNSINTNGYKYSVCRTL